MQSISQTEVHQYFQRIGLEVPGSADVVELRRIVCAQMRSIPFENFDLVLGLGTDLDPDAVFKKMVLGHRGGCCFELNGLLKRVLDCLGYTVRPVLGRVHWRGDPGPRTHMLLLVTIGREKWLVDVGFGGPGLLEPLHFVCGQNVCQSNIEFRVIEDSEYGFLLQRIYEGLWKTLYSFDLTIVNSIDVEMANFFVTNHSDSFFTNSRIATIPTSEGRNTLLNYRVTQKTEIGEVVTALSDDDSYLSALSKYFGIELNTRYCALKNID